MTKMVEMMIMRIPSVFETADASSGAGDEEDGDNDDGVGGYNDNDNYDP